MKDPIEGKVRMGVVHPMLYPSTIKGDGPILETLTRLLRDDFFQAVEISHIGDENMRSRVRSVLREAGVFPVYIAQTRVILNRLNYHHEDAARRRQAIEATKQDINEAWFLGAKLITLMSGSDPGPEKREMAAMYMAEAMKELARYAEQKGGMTVALEMYDREVDKRCLIGPTDLSVEVCREVQRDCSNFGLTVDLAHLYLLGESPERSLKKAGRNVIHVHLGNCVIKDKKHPVYGDQHPRFSVSKGEVGVEELVAFVRGLKSAGFFKPKSYGELPVMSFEVRPAKGQEPSIILANAKRHLRVAWARA